jgi:phage terminase small subunit
MPKCNGHSKRSKKACKKDAILGGTVCHIHGGKAPQVLAAARRRLELAHITPDRTLLEIARIAYADVASFFNADGTLKKPFDLDEDQRATLAGFEACIGNVSAGDGKQDLIHKFKAWDKTKALEMLAKHFGMLTEKVEHSGALSISWEGESDSK